MNRNRDSYNHSIDPWLQKAMEDLGMIPKEYMLTPEEEERLCVVKKRYEKGELSENKMKKVSKRIRSNKDS